MKVSNKDSKPFLSRLFYPFGPRLENDGFPGTGYNSTGGGVREKRIKGNREPFSEGLDKSPFPTSPSHGKTAIIPYSGTAACSSLLPLPKLFSA
jgi:hypothetical protein